MYNFVNVFCLGGRTARPKGEGVIRGLKDKFFHLHKCRASFTPISNSNILSAGVRIQAYDSKCFIRFRISLNRPLIITRDLKKAKARMLPRVNRNITLITLYFLESRHCALCRTCGVTSSYSVLLFYSLYLMCKRQRCKCM